MFKETGRNVLITVANGGVGSQQQEHSQTQRRQENVILLIYLFTRYVNVSMTSKKGITVSYVITSLQLSISFFAASSL